MLDKLDIDLKKQLEENEIKQFEKQQTLFRFFIYLKIGIFSASLTFLLYIMFSTMFKIKPFVDWYILK